MIGNPQSSVRPLVVTTRPRGRSVCSPARPLTALLPDPEVAHVHASTDLATAAAPPHARSTRAVPHRQHRQHRQPAAAADRTARR